MAILMNTFDTYAGADGKPDSLSKKEVKALLKKELPGLIQVKPQTTHLNRVLLQKCAPHSGGKGKIK